KVLFSDRSLMKELPYEAIVAIDKLKKIGDEGVMADMIKKGIKKEKAKEYLDFIRNMKPNETVQIILDSLKAYGFNESEYVFEPTIARSFSYSDGPIWEVVIPEYTVGSVLGGERFNNLAKEISGVDVPGTGFAIGFDRTVEAADQLGLIPTDNVGTQVLVTIFDENTRDKSLEIASKLRKAKISTELYPAQEKLAKQFKLANQKNIPWVIVIGEEEVQQNKVTLKNMESGEQNLIDIEDAIKKI
ncbi:MAG: His/Gly/Thr/Pro-type tRNA ligase C-terminal domain-containing protein, partial [Patescibacteria group bacterium]